VSGGGILFTDVHYLADGTARAAGALADGWSDPTPRHELTLHLGDAAPYEAGSFYLRELPCILPIVRWYLSRETVHTIVVDGYVDLGARPGLGRRLHDRLADEGASPAIVGVAKTAFVGADAAEVHRGGSERPLFVTALGLDREAAAAAVASMHGEHRLPTLLGWVDHLARGQRLPRP